METRTRLLAHSLYVLTYYHLSGRKKLVVLLENLPEI